MDDLLARLSGVHTIIQKIRLAQMLHDSANLRAFIDEADAQLYQLILDVEEEE